MRKRCYANPECQPVLSGCVVRNGHLLHAATPRGVVNSGTNAIQRGAFVADLCGVVWSKKAERPRDRPQSVHIVATTAACLNVCLRVSMPDATRLVPLRAGNAQPPPVHSLLFLSQVLVLYLRLSESPCYHARHARHATIDTV